MAVAAAMTLGRISLILALGCALWSVVAGVAAAIRGRAEFATSARRGVYAVAGLSLLAMTLLEVAYLTDNFGWALVAGNSSTTTPLLYKATAMWSSQEGSLLLWLVILSVVASLSLAASRHSAAHLQAVATATLGTVAVFFAGLLVFYADPFRPLAAVPLEGNGLQPLLRYPLMAVHPVLLYLGYAGMAVPFAFAVAALVTARADGVWLRASRRSALIAWSALAAGLIFGARWSYAELGWGGYWAWDPVENAALMPWLTATAFLHSAVVQEKRGMLKVWNVSLVSVSFLLSIIGTFLVRSGILDSIHAFGASTLGVPFLAFIATIVIGAVGLIAWRAPRLRSEHSLDSLLSREAIFLLNNLMLVGLAFVIFWGTFFPLISEAITGTKASVGPPWYQAYVPPMGIALVLLTGIGSVVAWRRATPALVARSAAGPAALAVVAFAVLSGFGDALSHPAALVTFVFAAFSLGVVAQEFWRGASARRAATGEPRAAALRGVTVRNRRRYGGYLIHAGVAVLLVGVAASSSFETARDVQLRPGQSARVAGYDVRYGRARASVTNERIALAAMLEVTRNGRNVAVLRPARNLFRSQDASLGSIGRFFSGEATSEVGLRATLTRDLWFAMQPDLQDLKPAIAEANQRFAEAPGSVQALVITAIAGRWQTQGAPVTFRMIVRTGVSWIWLGAAIMGLGALIAGWPRRGPRPSSQANYTQS